MKRVIPILLALLLLLLTACSASEKPSSSKPEKSSSPTSKSASEPSSKEKGPEPDNLPQDDDSSFITDIPQEEQEAYSKKYLRPYYIVGLLNTTWSDPEEIDVLRYMQFFTYNEDYNYYMSLGNTLYKDHSVPADVVEKYITSYFEVDPAYLRTSDKYDASTNCYLSMANEGIGDGPGVNINWIEKDGDLWKFVCEDISGNILSVTIRMLEDGSFHYVAGAVRELIKPFESDEQFDTMALGDHAQVLTQHIIDTVFEYRDIAVGDYPALSEAKFTAFAMGVVKYLEGEAYQYHDIACQEDGYWHFQADRLKGMVKEVFAAGDWEPNWGPDRESWPLDYDEDRHEYIADLAFDFWNYMVCKFMATVIDPQNEIVIVDYDLYSSSLYPDPKKIATMSTNYSIHLRDDGTPYLRYEGTTVESVSK